MTPPASENGEPSFRVAASGAVAAEIRQLSHQAASERRGAQFMAALRKIVHRLGRDPRNFGDPNYRLPAMRLQVRTAIVPPLIVHFAVSEDRPEVYIKALKLL